MNEAIKLAIEKGGYSYPVDNWYSQVQTNEVVLDPLFWRSLGKALGWKSNPAPERPEWLKQALWHHETVLAGGSTEKFWKDLLNE